MARIRFPDGGSRPAPSAALSPRSRAHWDDNRAFAGRGSRAGAATSGGAGESAGRARGWATGRARRAGAATARTRGRRLADSQLHARRHDPLRRYRLADQPLDWDRGAVPDRHDCRRRPLGCHDHLPVHPDLTRTAATIGTVTPYPRARAAAACVMMTYLDPQRPATAPVCTRQPEGVTR